MNAGPKQSCQRFSMNKCTEVNGQWATICLKGINHFTGRLYRFVSAGTFPQLLKGDTAWKENTLAEILIGNRVAYIAGPQTESVLSVLKMSILSVCASDGSPPFRYCLLMRVGQKSIIGSPDKLGGLCI